jgi:hypothetical protein
MFYEIFMKGRTYFTILSYVLGVEAEYAWNLYAWVS